MPKRVTTASIVVVRKNADGKNKRIPVPHNKSFNFTDDEIKTINAAHPGALRMPVNESVEDDEGAHTSDDSAAGEAKVKATANTGSKKKGKGKTKTPAAPAPVEQADEDDADDDAERESEDADDDGDADEDEDI